MKKELPPFEQWPFKEPSIKKTVKKVQELTKQLKEATSGEQAYKVWQKSAKLSDVFENEATHVSVLFSIETKNQTYKKAMDKLNQEGPYLSEAVQEFNIAMKNSPYRDYLESKLGSFYFTKIDYSLKGFSPEIIPELQQEADLSMKYDELIASCEIPFRDGVYNLPQMGKFMQDLDRETRKEAADAYYSYLDSHVKDEAERLYDELVHVRDKMAKKLGYKNYIELGYIRMGRYDYNAEMVASYREQIHTSVTPLVEKIIKDRYKRCGLRKPRIYDLALAFPDGNPVPKGTTQEKIEAAKKMYDDLAPETSDCFRFMADHHVLDLEAKPGKQTGGYMTYFPVYGTPFIFSNFNGTAGDVDVLTHEFGHSFQAYMAKGIKIPEYRSPTMEGAEIDSMSMEFFAEPWMDLFFDEPIKYRKVHLEDSIIFLPYGVTVDEFQHWVYENPNATPAERDQKWHEIEEKYTPYKIKAYEGCPYMMGGHRWLTQGHIFGSPFYYIDYTLAQVMAFQFFNLDRKNHALAWKRYIKLCKMGGKYPFVSLVKKDGMKSPFDEGVLEKTMRPLAKQLKSYNI